MLERSSSEDIASSSGVFDCVFAGFVLRRSLRNLSSVNRSWLRVLRLIHSIFLKENIYIYVLGQTFQNKRPLVHHIDDYAKERDVVVVQIDDNPCVALNLEVDAGQRLVLSNPCSPYLTRSDDMPLNCNQNWQGSS